MESLSSPTPPGEYFTWAEWESASTLTLLSADRRAIRKLCHVYLDPMRRRFGACTIHSAGRSHAKNAAVGGAERSYHLYRLRPGHAAADVSFATGAAGDWALMARNLGPTWSGPYPRHVHVDTRGLML